MDHETSVPVLLVTANLGSLFEMVSENSSNFPFLIRKYCYDLWQAEEIMADWLNEFIHVRQVFLHFRLAVLQFASEKTIATDRSYQHLCSFAV